MKIDDINIGIIRELKQGKKSFQLIAHKLDITENTVRSRVKKMTEEGFLEISGLIDPSSLPGHRMVIIGINLSAMNLVPKGQEISKLRGVVSASVVTGRYDLIVQVLFNEEFGLLEFYTDEIPKIHGIHNVETFVVYKSYNLMVPYVL